MRHLLGILFILLVLPAPGLVGDACAGAWLQPRRASFLKMTGLYSLASQRLDCAGDSAPAEPFGGDYVERKLFWYGEYGLVDALTLVGSFSWGEQEITGAVVPDYGTRSTGDLRIGGRWGLHRDPRLPVSLEGAVSLPTYPATDPGVPVGERAQFLPSGTGTIETELRAQIGASFWPLPFYANLDGGYRMRGDPFGDQWLLAAEIGASSTRFFGKVEVRGIWPTDHSCQEGTAGAVSVDERSLRFAPEGSVRIARQWWLGLSWSTLLSGRNTLDNDQWLLSLGWVRSGVSG